MTDILPVRIHDLGLAPASAQTGNESKSCKQWLWAVIVILLMSLSAITYQYFMKMLHSIMTMGFKIKSCQSHKIIYNREVLINGYKKIQELIDLCRSAESLGIELDPDGILKLLDPDPKYLVKFDYATALPVRDRNGRCIPVEIGEPGLFVSRVPTALIKDKMLKVYRGSNEANEKKLIRDAFEPGDIYFNHGDVLVQDKEYFVYFHDRIGDTFRWKGENVSTTEVANVLTGLPFVQDANVYGVKIPGHDGRAGMVAITMNEGHTLGERELRDLYDLATEQLPTYARPLFVRQLNIPIITGTFKQRKVELVKEAYNLDKITDPLFFLDTAKSTYRLLTPTDLTSFLKSKL